MPPSPNADRTRDVPCPPPTRAGRESVEMFLSVWQKGRFANRPEWSPRNRQPMSVLATDPGGVRLAVAHTRLRATTPLLPESLPPVAAALAAALSSRDRHYAFRFYPGFLVKALGSHPDLVSRTLAAWAAGTLPRLASGRHALAVPVRFANGRSGRVRLDLTVGRPGTGGQPVSVSAYRPGDPACLRPLLRKLLAGRLKRLGDIRADRRVLLLDIPWPTRATDDLAILRELAGRLMAEMKVEWLVLADMSVVGAKCQAFRVWDVAEKVLAEVLLPVIRAAPAVSGAGPLEPFAARAQNFKVPTKARNTLRAYAADWQDFRGWCVAHELTALPAQPETVALYLADRATTLQTSSLARRLTTINRAHEAAGHFSPATMRHAVVSEAWNGIRRKNGSREEGKRPLSTADLRKILAGLPDNLQGRRDRALLLTGLAGRLRRSELASLRIEDLTETAGGIFVRLRPKTDAEGQGRLIPRRHRSDPLTCPVRAIRAWIEAAAITSGPLFRGVDQLGFVSPEALCADSVAWIVKRAVGRIGLRTMEYAGHSLRAGRATQAAR